MSFDISTLEPQIRDILSAPGIDLTTISAKSVRRRLLEIEPSLTAEFLKEHKEEVDVVIASVFEAVSVEAGGVEPPPEPEHGRVNGAVKDEVEEYGEEDKAPSPPPKKQKKNGKVKKELSDAELARQLSNQINGRVRRSGAANGSISKKKKTHKSANFVDSDSDGDGSTKKKRRKSADGNSGGGRAKGGFAKQYWLSEPLAAVLNISQSSRPQVVKHLWEYIKGNDLQNPSNKREIMCDDGLRNVFGCDKINMFRMNKVLSMHLHENGE